MEKYSLIIRLKNKALSPKEYIEISKRILLELEQFHPFFKNLFGWGSEANSRQGFKEDKSDFEEIVFNQIHDKEIVYYNENPTDKEMHWDSKSWMHYTNSYSNTTKIKKGQITVSISFGSNKKSRGNLIIDFPQYGYPEFSNYEFVKKLFKKCMSFFEVEYAVVISNLFRRKVKIEGQSLWVGWMTYIKNKEVFDLLPASIQKEKLKNGTFFSLCNYIPTSDDNKMIQKAIGIRDSLGSKNLLNYPKKS